MGRVDGQMYFYDGYERIDVWYCNWKACSIITRF